jgi:hypothetical protein
MAKQIDSLTILSIYYQFIYIMYFDATSNYLRIRFIVNEKCKYFKSRRIFTCIHSLLLILRGLRQKHKNNKYIHLLGVGTYCNLFE